MQYHLEKPSATGRSSTFLTELMNFLRVRESHHLELAVVKLAYNRARCAAGRC
jgi:hypothetical protein